MNNFKHLKVIVINRRQLRTLVRGLERRLRMRLVFVWLTDVMPDLGAVEFELFFVR